MKQFNYLAPKSLPEALAFLAEHGDSAVVFSGGTDVVVRLRDNLIAPEYVIDIKKIPGLDTITFDEKTGLTIGACVTMNEIGANEYVQKYYPYLGKAALSVGSKQVRNRATCIGNIVNASPLADTGTPLLANDAVILAEGPEGKREIPIREFFIFVRKTALKKDEIVTAIGCLPCGLGGRVHQDLPPAARSTSPPSAPPWCGTGTTGASRSAPSRPPLCGSSRPRSCSAAKSWTAR